MKSNFTSLALQFRNKYGHLHQFIIQKMQKPGVWAVWWWQKDNKKGKFIQLLLTIDQSLVVSKNSNRGHNLKTQKSDQKTCPK